MMVTTGSSTGTLSVGLAYHSDSMWMWECLIWKSTCHSDSFASEDKQILTGTGVFTRDSDV